MTDVELYAITKAVEGKVAKTARAAIAPGEYTLSFDAHVEGTLRVGEDYEQRIPNKAKPWNLVALLMQEVNELRAAAGQVGLDLTRLVEMAENLDECLVDQAKSAAEEAAAKIKAETLTPCKGKVTADLTLGEIRR